MRRIDLNKRYDYKIDSLYKPQIIELLAINSFDEDDADNWESQKNGLIEFKKNIRIHLESKQKERCAYCRQYLQSSGKGEHLDHIVAKDTKPQWMFLCSNLVLSCSGCNVPKSAITVLNTNFINRTYYPYLSKAFKIFNPYHDRWSDHFHIDDEIFIQAKPNSKGDFTLSTCKLYREQVIINNSRELRMSKVDSKKKITHKIYTLARGTNEYLELQNSLNQIIRTT